MAFCSRPSAPLLAARAKPVPAPTDSAGAAVLRRADEGNEREPSDTAAADKELLRRL
jgi:hypothetical protein